MQCPPPRRGGRGGAKSVRKRDVQFHFPPAGPEELGLALHRGWANLMLNRFRDHVHYPNQPRPTAAEATNKDDEEAHAFTTTPTPLALGG